VTQMLCASGAEVAARANKLAGMLENLGLLEAKLSVEKDTVPVGGGSLPSLELESWVVAIRGTPSGASAAQIARRLREAPFPVVCRVREDTVCLDLRTLADDELPHVVKAVEFAVR